MAAQAGLVCGLFLLVGLKNVYLIEAGKVSWSAEQLTALGVLLRRAEKILAASTKSDDVIRPIWPSSMPTLGRHIGIADGLEDCIGRTPLLRIRSLSEQTQCDILAKVEFLNAGGGSPKDRVALNIVSEVLGACLILTYKSDALYNISSTLWLSRGDYDFWFDPGIWYTKGPLDPQESRWQRYVAQRDTMLTCEFNSAGDASTTQISRCMPSDQSSEKSELLVKLGAVVERVPPAPIVDPMHYVNRAKKLALEHTANPERPGRGFFANQFETDANWRAHYETTGPEIFKQCGGNLDAFVTGAGTGGTISGVSRFLKPLLPDIFIVLADPQGSGLYNRIKYGVMYDTKEKEGTRRRQQVDSIVEGIGLTRSTPNFEAGQDLIDDAVRINDDEAQRMARSLMDNDGLFIGSSSAVNCAAAVKVAQRLGPGHRVVTLLCDSGSRHLSKFWASSRSQST